MSSSFLWLAELPRVTTLPKAVGSQKSLGSFGQAWQRVFAGAQQCPVTALPGSTAIAQPALAVAGCGCGSHAAAPAPSQHRGHIGVAEGKPQARASSTAQQQVGPGEQESHPASSHMELLIPTAPGTLGCALDWHVLKAQPSEQPGSALSVGPCFSTHLHEECSSSREHLHLCGYAGEQGPRGAQTASHPPHLKLWQRPTTKEFSSVEKEIKRILKENWRYFLFNNYLL